MLSNHQKSKWETSRNKNTRLLESLDLHVEKQSTELQDMTGSKFSNVLDVNIGRNSLKHKKSQKNFELSDRYDERLNEQERALSFILNHLGGLRQGMEKDRNTTERKWDELNTDFKLTI